MKINIIVKVALMLLLCQGLMAQHRITNRYVIQIIPKPADKEGEVALIHTVSTIEYMQNKKGNIVYVLYINPYNIFVCPTQFKWRKFNKANKNLKEGLNCNCLNIHLSNSSEKIY